MMFLLKPPFSYGYCCECHNQMVSPIECSNENLSIHGKVFLHEIRPIPRIPNSSGANQIMRSIESSWMENTLEKLHKQVNFHGLKPTNLQIHHIITLNNTKSTVIIIP